MKKLSTLFVLLAIMTACQESLEERCERECVSYTKRHCPLRVASDVILDSMTFDRTSHTISYCYTIGGVIDDRQLIERNNPRTQLLQEVKNSTHLKLYKEAGYSFRYVYYSAKTKGTQLFQATFLEADYN